MPLRGMRKGMNLKFMSSQQAAQGKQQPAGAIQAIQRHTAATKERASTLLASPVTRLRLESHGLPLSASDPSKPDSGQ